MSSYGEVSWWALPLAASPWPLQVIVILFLAMCAMVMAWFFISLQSKSVGIEFEQIWEAIKDDPDAVIKYRLGIYGLVAIIVFASFSRFA
jgi:hypothetical protein